MSHRLVRLAERLVDTLEVFGGPCFGYERHVVGRKLPELAQDLVDLVVIITVLVILGRRQWVAPAAREQEPSLILQRKALFAVDACHVQELGEDGTSGPDVDGLVVLLLEKNNLRRPVPARADVRRHFTLGLGEVFQRSALPVGNLLLSRTLHFGWFEPLVDNTILQLERRTYLALLFFGRGDGNHFLGSRLNVFLGC